MTSAPQPVPAVTIAGRYEVLRKLGQGAFGHTFLVRDRELDRDVALKLLNPERTEDFWKARELLDREADVLRSLSHRGIPAVYEVLLAEWRGNPATFLAMEYIEGTTLADLIESRRSLAAAEVVHLFLELLAVLEYLHGRVPPILHRDIKPANILVRPDGSPALVDFGSVRHAFFGENEGGSTIAGTYGYMPYEQYMGQASPASDLYALAATFLHLTTGRAPREFMNDHGRIAVPSIFPGDSRLHAVIVRLLRTSPAERFASAREAREALVSTTSLTIGEPRAEMVSRPQWVPDSSTQERLTRVHETLADATPRPMTSARYALLHEMSPRFNEYVGFSMDSDEDRSTVAFQITLVTVVAVATAITLGIYPWAIGYKSFARRRHLEQCLVYGHACKARVESIAFDDLALTERVSRIRYAFELDGTLVHHSDLVFRATAVQWQAGDVIEILYIPGRNVSAIVSGR